jgi:hypothetical protein
MAKGKRRKERLRALKLAARGDDVAMDGGTSGPMDSPPPPTAFAITASGPTPATDDATTTRTTTTQTTTFSSDVIGREKKTPTIRKAIAKRKKRALDRALSHAERRGVKADRKKLRKCSRAAAKDVY